MHLLRRAVPLTALFLVSTAPPAQAASLSESLNVPLPVEQPTSFSVSLLGHTVYTPTLTNGRLTLSTSVSGQGGTLQLQTAGFSCPASANPKPVLNVVLNGAGGEAVADGSISGTTADPQSGGPNAFYQKIGFGPTAVSTEPVPVLTICSS